jgi:hypothetical protein
MATPMNLPTSDSAEGTDAVMPTQSAPGPVSVVAVVSLVAGVDPQDTLDAVGSQSLPPTEVRLIGSSESEAPTGVVLSGDLEEVVAGLDTGVDYVWILHGDARPRPDALGALVAESERFEASLAGSKLLVGGTDDTLESVGSATDAFGEPYSGLDEGEVDLEQYDVVRDVAFVSSVSMLVRRDLLRGMRGLDSALAPVAAGLDLSQRVRIAGGRVIVVPSSEVYHDRRCGRGDGGWREQSGRMRAMLKAYRPITLVWMIPFSFLVGIADSLGSLLLGRWRQIPRYLLTWAWNLVHLPSTLGLRRHLARVRQVGDEELFRYQVRGSVRLRQVGAELSDRALAMFDDDRPLARRATEIWNSPATWALLVALLIVMVGVRTVFLSGMPTTGFSLPFGDDPLDSLSRFAGGWNRAGLGTDAPVLPATGVAAAWQMAMLGEAGLARSLLTLVAFIAGVFGIGRLSSRLGVGGPWGYLAAVPLLFGLAAAYLGAGGRWPALIALALLPAAMATVIGPAATSRRAWWGMVGRSLATVAIVSSFVPWLAPVPLLFALVVKLAGRFESRPLVALVGISGGVIGVPYALSRSEHLVGGVPIAVDLDLIPFAVLVATVLLGMLAGSWRASALAGALAFGGLTAARVLGPDLQEAALAVGGVGMGLAVAGATKVRDRRNLVATVATVAAAGLVVISMAGLAGGRAGLGPDAWGEDRLGFMEMAASGVERSLLITPGPEILPGEARPGPGFWYRVVEAGEPTLDQAIIGPPAAGDDALHAIVTDLAAGATLAPGSALSEFGIRWVVAVGDAAAVLAPALDAQVDLVPLPLAEGIAVYENPDARTVAETESGLMWEREADGYGGRTTDDRIRLAIQGDDRWTPDWQAEGWSGTVSGSTGMARFAGSPLDLILVIAGGVLLVVGIGLAGWGRESRR